MTKKTFAVTAELLPIISAPLAIFLMVSPFDSGLIRHIINITTALGILGFVIFAGIRLLVKDSKLVLALGILDILATIVVIGFYVVGLTSY